MIFSRWCEDDFIAQITADAIEKAGGTVVSVAYNGSGTHHGAMAPHSKYIVFARATDEKHIGKIDVAISKALEAI